MLFVRILLTLVLVVSSGAQYVQAATSQPAIVQGSYSTIEQLLMQPQFSIFWSFWSASQLSGQLTPDNPYTLFLPTNEAWNRSSPNDQMALLNCLASSNCIDQLQVVVRNHVWVRNSSLSEMLFGQPSTCQNFGNDMNTLKCTTANTQFSIGPNSRPFANVAVTRSLGLLFVNGARVVSGDYQVQQFTVHLIDKWLYPIDTDFSAFSYVASTDNNAATSASLVSTTCVLCSPLFKSMMNQIKPSTTGFYDWVQNTVSPFSSSITLLIPYAQPLLSEYSINTLASMIQSIQNSSNGPQNLFAVTAAHVVASRVLYQASWAASDSMTFSCGPSNSANLDQYVKPCKIVRMSANSNNWLVEVGRTGASILYPDIPVENGVVHIVSNVLGYIYGNLWSVVSTHPYLTKFRAYVLADSTGAALNLLQATNAQYTVFVPDDAAFLSVGSALQTNVSLQQAVVKLGFMQGISMYSTLLSQIASVNSIYWTGISVAGNRLRIYKNASGILVDGGLNGFATTIITQPNIGASNGVLHIVSGNVFGIAQLTIRDFLLSRPDLSISAEYFSSLTTAWKLFGGSAASYTVLAPTNAAWRTMSASSKLASILNTSTIVRNNLMLRHYMSGSVQLFNVLATDGMRYLGVTLNGVVTFTAVSTIPPQFTASYSFREFIVTASINASDFVCTNGRVHVINSVLAIPTDAIIDNSLFFCQDPAACLATTRVASITLLLLCIITVFRNSW